MSINVNFIKAFLFKEKNKTVKIVALRKIKGNKKYITSKFAEVLAAEVDKTRDKPLHQNLSDRELEIMKHIALGKSVSQIEDILSISINTVNTYRARVLTKMGMKTNTRLAIYALENGMISKTIVQLQKYKIHLQIHKLTCSCNFISPFIRYN